MLGLLYLSQRACLDRCGKGDPDEDPRPSRRAAFRRASRHRRARAASPAILMIFPPGDVVHWIFNYTLDGFLLEGGKDLNVAKWGGRLRSAAKNHQ